MKKKRFKRERKRMYAYLRNSIWSSLVSSFFRFVEKKKSCISNENDKKLIIIDKKNEMK